MQGNLLAKSEIVLQGLYYEFCTTGKVCSIEICITRFILWDCGICIYKVGNALGVFYNNVILII